MTLLKSLLRRARRPIDFTRALNHKLSALVEGSANESRLLNEKSNAIIEGIDNQSKMLNRKLDAVIALLDRQTRLLSAVLDAVAASVDDPSRLLRSHVQSNDWSDDPPETSVASFKTAQASSTNLSSSPPLMLAERTYNTSHPDYDATIVRNFPGKILNVTLPSSNPAYVELTKLATGDVIADEAWATVLQDALDEAKTVPHSDLVLQRRNTLEQHMTDLSRRYKARYLPGWVNFDDALFLFWLVRRLKPKTIVQCGVCNGLSAAFITLALAKNGPEGRLYAIDLPPVFNSKDPNWTIPGKAYGIVIPEGKTSGWIVPEAYRKRFEVQNGDSKVLLPQLIDRLPVIDMFFHDSDHNYNHMIFEFREAKRKLARGGLLVADDISWNASIWDFADENRVPAYNFKGAVGVAFF
jgi:predicted O-methyltransferase YrrM